MNTESTYGVTNSQRMEAVKNTIIWGGFNTVFGICPALILLGLSRMPLRPDVCAFAQDAYLKLMNDGSPIFFFLAMIGSATIDVYIGRQRFTGSFAWLMFALGGISITLIIFFYMAFLLGGDERHSFGQARWIFRYACAFTFFFCSIAKYQLTLKELLKTREENS